MSHGRPPAADELDDARLVLIDGDNLLHRVRGSRDEAGVAWLLPRLRGWRPAHLRVIVALDGHPAPGEGVRRRAAPGIEFVSAGSRTADDALIDELAGRPWAERGRTIVVSDDAGLRRRALRLGGLTRSVGWLMARVARPSDAPARGHRTQHGPTSGAAIGRGRPAGGRPVGRGPDDTADQPEGPAWSPGRGATRKRGNPRRPPRGPGPPPRRPGV